MTRTILPLFLCLAIGQIAIAQYNYPYTKMVDSSDTWHMVSVKDPYRWLEALDKPEVLSWFKTQAAFTDSLLNHIPFTDEVYDGLVKTEQAKPRNKFGFKRVGNSIYYNQLDSTLNKFILWRQPDGAGEAEIVATPELWGAGYRIVNWEVDPAEQFIAIVAQEGGKEYNDARIYSISQHRFLPDIINGNYKGMVNNQPGTVYYWQTPSYDPHVYNNPNDYVFKKHTIGTDTTADKVWVSRNSNPELMNFSGGNYLWEITTYPQCQFEFAWVVQSAPIGIWYRKSFSNDKWQQLFNADDQVYLIKYYNNKIYYPSFKNAPNGKLMEMDLANPARSHKTIMPEQKDPMEGADITQTKNYLIVQFTHNGVKTYSDFFHLPTKKLTSSLFQENSSKIMYKALEPLKNDSVLIIRQDWASPDLIMNGSIGSKREVPNKNYPNTKSLFQDKLLVEEIEIASYDGTMVPLTIIRRKDLKMNGQNVALVQGYGAYGDRFSPSYNQFYTMLAAKGVVICVAHPRGGGEKGDNWRIAGYKQSKANTWKDFNACAEYLINKGYTSAQHLCCTGASAGGILIGRAITERPDLWACAIPEAAVLNPLRGKYSAYGDNQNDEFGALENINDFFSMLETDAVLHLQQKAKYPAMLVITGWEDPRVSCWQSGKFIAAAQHTSQSGRPALLKVNFKGGHAGNTSADRQTFYNELAKRNAFMLWQCDYEHANRYE